jgi:hypothetical protein
MVFVHEYFPIILVIVESFVQIESFGIGIFHAGG